MRDQRSLYEELRLLDEQVKKLVRTERGLSLVQHNLDRELRKVEALTALDLHAGRAESNAEILRLAMETLISLYSLDQGLGLQLTEEESLEVVSLVAVPGMEGNRERSQVKLSLKGYKLPEVPWIGSAGARDASLKISEEFIQTMDFIFSPIPEETSCPFGTALALPISDKAGKVIEILLMRRTCRAPTLLDSLPTSADLPFFRLMCAHIAMAVQNLRSYQALSEAVRSRDDFLSIASHELKTPLTSMLLTIQLLGRNSSINPSLAPKVASLEMQGRRLGALIEQLLDVARIRAGKLAPNLKEMDLAVLLREVLAKYADDIKHSGSSCSVHAPASLPVRADPSQMEQVIANLVSNAIKYGNRRSIVLRLGMHRGRIRLRVRDHGLGISQNDQKRIFGRFERASSGRNFSGLGLGLYISRQIVESHCGELRVVSAEGRGSIFVLEIPAISTCP